MERQTSNILLGMAGSEDRFTLKFGLFKFRLSIKPITARQLIEISAEVSQIKEVNKDQDMFPALMGGITDIKHIARIVAIATGTRFKTVVTRAVMKLPLNDIQTLFAIVYKQSDPSPFFFIISLTGKMNILKKKKG